MAANFTLAPRVSDFKVTETGLSLQTQDSSAQRLIFKPGLDVCLLIGKS